MEKDFPQQQGCYVQTTDDQFPLSLEQKGTTTAIASNILLAANRVVQQEKNLLNCSMRVFVQKLFGYNRRNMNVFQKVRTNFTVQ